jgi:hypothetical protein
MRLLRRACAAVRSSVLLLLAPGALAGQSIDSPYRHIEPAQSVAVFGGYLATDRGELDLGLASGPTIGVRYAGRFAAPVAGVVRLSITPSERTIYSRENATDLEAPLTAVGEASAAILAAEAGIRLLLTGPRTWHSLAPYLEATGGLLAVAGSRTDEESQLPTNQVVDFGPSFAVGVAAGTDWFLTDRLSTNLSLRGLLWRLPIPEGLSTTGAEEAEWTRNFGVSIGAAFHF